MVESGLSSPRVRPIEAAIATTQARPMRVSSSRTVRVTSVPIVVVAFRQFMLVGDAQLVRVAQQLHGLGAQLLRRSTARFVQQTRRAEKGRAPACDSPPLSR